jgi:hypothetical protein
MAKHPMERTDGGGATGGDHAPGHTASPYAQMLVDEMRPIYGTQAAVWAGWLGGIDHHLAGDILGVLHVQLGNGFVGEVQAHLRALRGTGERPLRAAERAWVYPTFGASIDYTKVRIIDGGALTMGISGDSEYGRTIRNEISLPTSCFEPGTGDLNANGLDLLSHEMGHVWQYQHGGLGYIQDSLLHQIAFGLEGRDPYDWKRYAEGGVSFERWNPEAQAEMGHDYNKALRAVQDAIAAGRPPELAMVNTLMMSLPYALLLMQGVGATQHRSFGEKVDELEQRLLNPILPELIEGLG